MSSRTASWWWLSSSCPVGLPSCGRGYGRDPEEPASAVRPSLRLELAAALAVGIMLAAVPLLIPCNITCFNLEILSFFYVARCVGLYFLGGFAGYLSFFFFFKQETAY